MTGCAKAIEAKDAGAIGWAILAMSVAIIVYDQLLFRPLVAWGEKFRVEQSAAQTASQSWVLDLLARSRLVNFVWRPLEHRFERLARARLSFHTRRTRGVPPSRTLDAIWYAGIAAAIIWLGWRLRAFLAPVFPDLGRVARDGLFTLTRVIVLTLLASLIWVPAGVWIGLRPRITKYAQPLAQFLAAFPANLLFPVAVFLVIRYRLAPAIWLSPLMILGTQWYILFNVIAGASAFPSDLREAAASLRLGAWRRWSRVLLPGIFPYFVTGAITASGGAWNASIVSEAVSWGKTRLLAPGLGAYIAEQTAAGDFARIALGVAVMSALVVTMNRLLWRPLYLLAERRTRLD